MTMLTLAEAATAMHGELQGEDVSFAAVSTDTRTLRHGELFIALRGERFDAREFVADAARLGAAGAVVEETSPAEIPQIHVPDSRVALADLARAWRRRFDIPLIGITGSNGKTTVKELTAAILRARFAADGAKAVMATQGNLNNEIGVPLTLLRLRASHKAAVVEMGANQPNDIELLAAIAEMNIAIITCAARAHLEGFGTLQEVARTKGQLVENLPDDAVAVLNRDDQYFEYWWKNAAPARRLSFGMHAEADYRAADVKPFTRGAAAGFEFTLLSPEGSTNIVLPLAGEHNIMNALAAAAATLAAGATLDDVRTGLANSSNVAGRLRSFTHPSGAVIYDDSYNANPDSVGAAIQLLAGLPDDACLVLGDMGELGDDALEQHKAIGAQARAAGVQSLMCTGELSRATAAGFGTGARWFASTEELGDVLVGELREGMNVLVKASRFMGLDELVKRIECRSGAAVSEGS